ncbi:sulfotransferase [Streptomyces buecherae]|uniref:sulfotransferase n=1 Tax=Streptomyces buecherae TaxID=2763006 RepID=UPI001C266D39|nr:sulfotransferase [Streptomyces buecherae]
MRSLTFIVGTGRSGSSALSRIVNRHPDILSLNELYASLGSTAFPTEPITGARFRRILTDPNPVFDTLTRSGVPLPEFLYTRRPGRYAAETTGIPALSLMVLPHLTDDPDGLLDEVADEVSGWPPRPVARHYVALFELLAARFGRSAVIERSGYSLGWVPRLSTAFPTARFVHLFRDGPDCALSMSRHCGYRAIALLREVMERSNVTDLSELTPDHVRALPADLSALLGDRFDGQRLVMDREMPVEGFGALWSELVTEGVGLLAELPEERRMTLAYEDLLDAPERELARLAEFAGVTPRADWLAAGRAELRDGSRGSALRLPDAELATLRERCAPGTRALGRA